MGWWEGWFGEAWAGGVFWLVPWIGRWVVAPYGRWESQKNHLKSLNNGIFYGRCVYGWGGRSKRAGGWRVNGGGMGEWGG